MFPRTGCAANSPSNKARLCGSDVFIASASSFDSHKVMVSLARSMVANQICAFKSLCLLYGWYNLVAPNGYRILGLARYQLRIDHSCIHNCLLWQWCAPSFNVAHKWVNWTYDVLFAIAWFLSFFCYTQLYDSRHSRCIANNLLPHPKTPDHISVVIISANQPLIIFHHGIKTTIYEVVMRGIW